MDERDAVLQELRDLVTRNPEDACVRENIALGLYNTMIDYTGEKRLVERDVLLQELRDLAARYPEDAVVRERLAWGLYNTLIYYTEENRLPERDSVLKALSALLNAHPDDPDLEPVRDELQSFINEEKLE
jgi:hypothetical protein